MTTKTIECGDATSFLEAISPIGPHLAFDDASWVFRGEGPIAAPSPLVPSALRPDNFKRLVGLVGSQRPDDIDDTNVSELQHKWLEFMVLGRFFREADRFGLPIPEDRQELRRKFQHEGRTYQLFVDRFQYDDWLPNELLSLAGLAQHYGLPTRLLDWTRNHLAATYFASKDTLQTEKPDGESLAVWALNEAEVYGWDGHFANDGPLQIVTAPAALNPNLRAQQGLFTLWRSTLRDEAPVNRDPLNVLLEDFKHVDADQPVFYQFTLPAHQACDLLKKVLELGMTAGALFPGFKGATDSLEDYALVRSAELPQSET